MIKYDRSRCICLKNKQKSCNIQCTHKRDIDSVYCKRHLNGRFKHISEYNLTRVQAYIRGELLRREINTLFGPALKDPVLSFDNIDPISHEYIWEMKDDIKTNIGTDIRLEDKVIFSPYVEILLNGKDKNFSKQSYMMGTALSFKF